VTEVSKLPISSTLTTNIALSWKSHTKNVQECILWMNPKDVKDVPQHCLDHYEDNCDMKNPSYDEESCGPLISNL
ncbi:hypothetical protein MRX96_049829, partial [Rhipicephalus microplus]